MRCVMSCYGCRHTTSNMPRGKLDQKTFHFTDVSITRPGGVPAHMCMVTMHPDKTIYLLRSQVQSLLCPSSCKAHLFTRLRQKGPHSSHFQAHLPIMLRLKARHLVKPRASHAQLLSKKTCYNILRPMGVDKITLNSIAALTPQGQGSSSISMPAQDAAAAPLHTAGLPATLPKAQYTPQQLTSKYGIHTTHAGAKQLQQHPLQSQLVDLHEFLTKPINLNRGQIKFISEQSWRKSYKAPCNAFLGFCMKFQGIAQPTLEHMMDAHHFAAFMDFMIQRVRGC